LARYGTGFQNLDESGISGKGGGDGEKQYDARIAKRQVYHKVDEGSRQERCNLDIIPTEK